jgi:hypothetical protein
MPVPPESGGVIIGGNARVGRVSVSHGTFRGGDVGVWIGGETIEDAQVTDIDWEGPPRVERVPGVARNAPCPCGSGRKYKRCCGRPKT